jgi:hypothetical protein
MIAAGDWMKVSPGPSVPYSNVSPEFGVDAGDGAVIVEVHARQLDGSQAQGLQEHHEDLLRTHRDAVAKANVEGRRGNVVTTGATELFPTGVPDPGKPGDSVLTNTISRFAGIKSKETQIDPELPFVLWLDIHDPTVWGLDVADQLFSPLYSQQIGGKVNCGPFWFALYGRKGDPLLASRGYDYRSMPMAHEGRFKQVMKSHGGQSRVSAVVFSFPKGTVLMENPNAVRPLTSRFRARMLKSVLPAGPVDCRVEERAFGTDRSGSARHFPCRSRSADTV